MPSLRPGQSAERCQQILESAHRYQATRNTCNLSTKLLLGLRNMANDLLAISGVAERHFCLYQSNTTLPSHRQTPYPCIPEDRNCGTVRGITISNDRDTLTFLTTSTSGRDIASLPCDMFNDVEKIRHSEALDCPFGVRRLHRRVSRDVYVERESLVAVVDIPITKAAHAALT